MKINYAHKHLEALGGEGGELGQLATALLGMTAGYLRLRMRELGMKYTGDSVVGLSTALWRTTQETPQRLLEEEALELEQLSHQCGGWWDLKETGEDVFVPTEEWERRYAEGL